EVDDPRAAGAGKVLGADVGVVDEVGGEEEGRGDEGGDHHAAMGPPAPVADEDVSRHQKDGGERIESGVEGGKVLDAEHGGGILPRRLSWRGKGNAPGFRGVVAGRCTASIW